MPFKLVLCEKGFRKTWMVIGLCSVNQHKLFENSSRVDNNTTIRNLIIQVFQKRQWFVWQNAGYDKTGQRSHKKLGVIPIHQRHENLQKFGVVSIKCLLIVVGCVVLWRFKNGVVNST